MTTDDPPTPVPAPPPVTNGAAAPKKTKATSGNSDGDVNWYLPAVFGLVVGALVVCSKRDKKEAKEEEGRDCGRDQEMPVGLEVEGDRNRSSAGENCLHDCPK